MSNIIQWKLGSKFSGSAEGTYAELEKIRKRDGNITPSAIVAKAKSKSSAMHRHFEWDDDKAANQHRLEQARLVARSIQIIHIESPNAPAQAYSIITIAQKNGEPKTRKVYQSTEEALKDPVMRDEILGNAIREAISYRRKYAALQELSKVFHAMDEFMENFG